MTLQTAELKVSLTKAIQRWADDQCGSWDIDYLGDNTITLMADAALAVLLAVEDLNKFYDEEILDKE